MPFIEHRCCHPGCTEWGTYGHGARLDWSIDDPRIRRYCRAHDPCGGRGALGVTAADKLREEQKTRETSLAQSGDQLSLI